MMMIMNKYGDFMMINYRNIGVKMIRVCLSDFWLIIL